MLRCHFPQIFPNEELPHLWLFVEVFIFLSLVLPLMTTTSTSGCSQLQVAKLCAGSERGRHRKRTERESQEIARKPGIWRKPQAQLDPKPRASYQGSQLLHLTSLHLFFQNHFIYLFLAGLGLHCCMGLSLVPVSGGYSLVDGAQASHYGGFFCCRAPVSRVCGLSSRGSRPLEHRLGQ